jgi:hypothetical protein
MSDDDNTVLDALEAGLARSYPLKDFVLTFAFFWYAST